MSIPVIPANDANPFGLDLRSLKTIMQIRDIGGMNGACAELAIYIMKILYFNHRSNIMSIYFAPRWRSDAGILP